MIIFPPQTTIQLLSLPHSLSLSLLCYSQTIQAINALTSSSDRHNYKKTEQCNSSIQDGLFEHSVTLLGYPSPCLRRNFSPQKRHKEKGRVPYSPGQRAHLAPAGKPSLVPCAQRRLAAGDGIRAPSSSSSGRSTQHASEEANFQGLDPCNPSQEASDPRDGK